MKLSLKYVLVLSVVAIASQSSVVVFADEACCDGGDEGMLLYCNDNFHLCTSCVSLIFIFAYIINCNYVIYIYIKLQLNLQQLLNVTPMTVPVHRQQMTSPSLPLQTQ